MATFPTVLDTCALYPAMTRDLLLRAAESELYRPHWSPLILDELTRNLVKSTKCKMTVEGAQYLVSQMTRAFPEAMVNVPQTQINAMLNDPKDRHVAAAAVISHSTVIVTTNLKHFRPEHLLAWGIETKSPDQFLSNLFDLFPREMENIVETFTNDFARRVPIPEMIERIRLRLPDFGSRLWPIFSGMKIE